MKNEHYNSEVLKTILAQGEEAKIIGILLSAVTADEDFKTSIQLISSRYASLNKEEQKGLITKDLYGVEIQKIREALYAILKELPQDISIHKPSVESLKRYGILRVIAVFVVFGVISFGVYWSLSLHKNAQIELYLSAPSVFFNPTSKVNLLQGQKLFVKELHIQDVIASDFSDCFPQSAPFENGADLSMKNVQVKRLFINAPTSISMNDDCYKVESEADIELALNLDANSSIGFSGKQHHFKDGVCSATFRIRDVFIESDDSITMKGATIPITEISINNDNTKKTLYGQLSIGNGMAPLKKDILLKDIPIKVGKGEAISISNLRIKNKEISLLLNGPLRFLSVGEESIRVTNLEWFWHYERLKAIVFGLALSMFVIITANARYLQRQITKKL